VVLAPDVSEMYPSTPCCTVDVSRLADHLCGRHRPGHFRGVATVVMKLLHIVQPDRAYFGEKDAQQLAIVRRLIHDLNVPVTIVGVPTVREPDGLALSSRNRLLSTSERELSPVLYQALCEADRQIASGVKDTERIIAAAGSHIPHHPLLRLEYFEIVDPDGLQPVRLVSAPVLVAGALWVGQTRLIDNVRSTPPSAARA
jgi:pantoate--beta-alanine ligase